MLLGIVAFVHAHAADWRSLLDEAGNSNDELERHRLLLSLEAAPDLPEVMRRDLSELLIHIGHWAREDFVRPAESSAPVPANRLGFFFRQEGLNEHLLPRIPDDSPLHPLYCLYRGRMLIQTIIQSRGAGRSFDEWVTEGRRLLKIARDAYPKNQIVRMYLDEPFEGWPHAYARD